MLRPLRRRSRVSARSAGSASFTAGRANAFPFVEFAFCHEATPERKKALCPGCWCPASPQALGAQVIAAWVDLRCMRPLSFAALIVGVLLIPTALGVAKRDRDRDVSEVERALVAETDKQSGALESYFTRARSIDLLTANAPAFANVLAEPGTRTEKAQRQSRNVSEVTHHLAYL